MSGARTACVELVPVSVSNYVQVYDVELKPSQKMWVAGVPFSLVQAAYEPHWEPRAVCAGDVVVGFVMGGITSPGVYEIARLVIDRRQQGRGYGRAALALLLSQLRARPEIRLVELGVLPGNESVDAFYARFGFSPSEKRCGDERVLSLALPPA